MEKRNDEFPLKTISNLVDAGQWIFNATHRGTIDGKTADSLNTTLKGQQYLLATLPLKMAELYVRAQIKKITLPDKLLAGISG